MFRWAVARGDLDSNPMEGMCMPAVSAPRERVLSDAEIAKLWNGLPNTMRGSPSCQRIIKICLLTAQRVGEVSGMRLDELDLKARTWTVPTARSKNKDAHTVPLSDAAVDVIEEARADARGQNLFPDDVGKGSLRADAVSKMMTKAQGRVGIDPSRVSKRKVLRLAIALWPETIEPPAVGAADGSNNETTDNDPYSARGVEPCNPPDTPKSPDIPGRHFSASQVIENIDPLDTKNRRPKGFRYRLQWHKVNDCTWKLAGDELPQSEILHSRQAHRAHCFHLAPRRLAKICATFSASRGRRAGAR